MPLPLTEEEAIVDGYARDRGRQWVPNMRAAAAIAWAEEVKDLPYQAKAAELYARMERSASVLFEPLPTQPMPGTLEHVAQQYMDRYASTGGGLTPLPAGHTGPALNSPAWAPAVPTPFQIQQKIRDEIAARQSHASFARAVAQRAGAPGVAGEQLTRGMGLGPLDIYAPLPKPVKP